MRRKMEKAYNKLNTATNIFNWKRIGIMSVDDFKQDAEVSAMFLPNKCANTGKSTSQLLDFSSL